MGRLTKEQRRLRDAFKGGAESEFCEALCRMGKAAGKASTGLQNMIAAVNAIRKLAFRRIDDA